MNLSVLMRWNTNWANPPTRIFACPQVNHSLSIGSKIRYNPIYILHNHILHSKILKTKRLKTNAPPYWFNHYLVRKVLKNTFSTIFEYFLVSTILMHLNPMVSTFLFCLKIHTNMSHSCKTIEIKTSQFIWKI